MNLTYQEQIRLVEESKANPEWMLEWMELQDEECTIPYWHQAMPLKQFILMYECGMSLSSDLDKFSEHYYNIIKEEVLKHIKRRLNSDDKVFFHIYQKDMWELLKDKLHIEDWYIQWVMLNKFEKGE